MCESDEKIDNYGLHMLKENSNKDEPSQDITTINNLEENNKTSINNEENETYTKLEDKILEFENENKNLKSKIELLIKQKDTAVKEKETMVIRYATSEKNVLQQKQQKEQWEKKYKENLKENEILQHKVQTMSTEKARICQMLDNKTYEYKTVQQELERTKTDLITLETKLKWSQTNLKSEMEINKKNQVKIDNLNTKINELTSQIDDTKKEAQESIKSFQISQENRAFILDQQVKEQQASLILLKYEKDDKEQQNKLLNLQLENIKKKFDDIVQENNKLSVKVQQLECDRLDIEQKLSELRIYSDQQGQDSANLLAKTTEFEQIKLQLQSEQNQLLIYNEQLTTLKQRNNELESDMLNCREKEAELLYFTQQLTDKNVRLQSEFTSLEIKVQQLSCEQTLLKRSLKEQETKTTMLSAQLLEERTKYLDELELLRQELSENIKQCDNFKQEAAHQKGENSIIKRKLELSIKEVNKELQFCRKRLEMYENIESKSKSSSNSSLSNEEKSNKSTNIEEVPSEKGLDKETLIGHIIKLDKMNAKKSERIDFLEEHVNTLVAELQKKHNGKNQRQMITSNTNNDYKAYFGKISGLLTSVYSSYNYMVPDTLLDSRLEINKKLQTVLEDVLLKNIILKESVDTMGKEIDRLNQLLKN